MQNAFTVSSTRSSARNRTVWEWGWRSAARSSKLMAAPCRFHRACRTARPSASPCRPANDRRMARIGRQQTVMSSFDVALSIVLGVGLAAATGFRVFLPMLVASIAANTGHLPLDNSFAWLGTPAALTMLGAAALAEIVAYYIPGVDNLLDTLATPCAFVAGTILSAAVMTDLPPMAKWTAAVIAGGGVAGLMQGITAALRAKSTILTGGMGNSVIATGELGGALLVSILALVAPVAALVLVIAILWLTIRLLRRLLRRAHP